jgi:hypothetical protein
LTTRIRSVNGRLLLRARAIRSVIGDQPRAETLTLKVRVDCQWVIA